MFQIKQITLTDRIYPFECIILALKIYYGPDKFNGQSKVGQYDEVKNSAPFPGSKLIGIVILWVITP